VYIEQLASWSGGEIGDAKRALAAGDDPMGWKARLARHLVARYHGEEGAAAAVDHFDRVVRRKEEPEEMPEVVIAAWAPTLWLPRLMKECGLAPSTSEARRLVESGGVAVDGERVSRPETELAGTPGAVYRLRVGRRRFAKVVIRG
jgi:tyrosyl-tRNA synthetase